MTPTLKKTEDKIGSDLFAGIILTLDSQESHIVKLAEIQHKIITALSTYRNSIEKEIEGMKKREHLDMSDGDKAINGFIADVLSVIGRHHEFVHHPY